MGKLSNCLSMIDILSTGKKYKIKELADKLEVTEKMIRIYKEELEIAGIYVSSIKGPYGGYYLNNTQIVNLRGLTKEDLKIINDLFAKEKDSKYLNVINKLNLICNKEENEKITKEDLFLYNSFSKAIEKRNKIKLTYYASKGTKRIRIVQPLQLLHFNSKWYVIVFCETKKEIRRLRFDGIKDMKIVKEIY